tara:strand:- start:1475 stop:6454 length:4980 start_codon:yes stop_codon:yes gene_type:complete
MLASGEVIKEANERFTIKSHSNGFAGGLRMISQDGTDTFQIHPDNNGYMYADKTWNFSAAPHVGIGNPVWHTGNDGSGSGLDADLLDGYHKADINPAHSHYRWTGISASGTQARRFVIMRLYGCPAHWDNDWQDIHLKVWSEGYEATNLKYEICGDYQGAGTQATMFQLRLKDAGGSSEHQRFRLVLGTPVDAGWDHSGQDTYYVDVYAEASYYMNFSVAADFYSAGFNVNTLPTSGGATSVVYSSPVVSNITTFAEAKEHSYFANHKIWNAGNHGSSSGLDADLLDGQHGSYYLPKSGGTMTGAITTNGHNVVVASSTGMSTSGDWIRNTTAHGYIQMGPANTTHAHIYTDRSNFYFNVNTLYQNGHLIWGANNDGSGSGLDADLLDGQHASAFATLSGSNSFTNSYNEFGNGTGSVSNDGGWAARVNIAGTNHARLDVKSVSDGIITSMYSHTGHAAGKVGTYSNHPLHLMTNGTAQAVLSTSGSLSTTPQGTLWGAGNDGSGSGLDADLLDGQQGAYYYSKTNMDAARNIVSGTDLDTDLANGGAFSSYGSGGTSWNAPFSYGGVLGWGFTSGIQGQIGFDIRHNQSAYSDFWFRGKNNLGFNPWSKVWHTLNDGAGSGLDADLLDGKDSILFTRYRSVFGSGSNKNWNTEIADVGGAGRMHWDEVHNISTSWPNGPIATFSSAYTYGGVQSVYLGNQKYQMYVPHLASNGNGVYYRSGWGASQWYDWRVFLDSGNVGSYAWTSSNDGSGSGLDADLLDGQQGSYYLPTTGKAADSNLFDGIDSNRFIYGSNTSKVTRYDGDWDTMFGAVNTGFIDNASGTNGNPDGFTHHHGFQVRHNNMDNQWGFQFMGSYSSAYQSLYHRNVSASTWTAWKEIWDSGNDGSGSGLDADLLDGQHGSYYLPASGVAADSNLLDGIDSARVVYASGTNAMGVSRVAFGSLTNSRAGFFDFYNSGTPTGTWYSLVNMPHSSANHGHQIAGSFYSAGDIYNRNNNNTSLSAWAKIWNTANDGSGSGLDADLFDGQDSPRFFKSFSSSAPSAWERNNGNFSVQGGDASNVGLHMEQSNGVFGFQLYSASGTYGFLDGEWASWDLQKIANGNFSVDEGSGLMRVWNAGNDGSGSGLDADLLDGLDSAAFARLGGTSHNRTIPIRWFATGDNDNNIDYYTHLYAKAHMGNTYKYNTSRPARTTDSSYWVGTMGWGAIDMNTLFSYGSGDIDAWANPANQPSGTSHWVGSQHLHYHNGSTGYGTQRVTGAGSPALTYIRGIWGGGFTSWFKDWNAANDGAGSGLDADLLDGQHGSYYRPASQATTLTGAVTGSGSTSITTSNPYQNSVNFSTNGPDSSMEYQQLSGITDTKLAPSGDWHNTIRLGHGDPYSYYSNTLAMRMTGTGMGDIYTQSISSGSANGWGKHWSTRNDGSGSGLDADLLDGYNAEEGAVNNSIVKRDGTASIKAHGLSLMRASTQVTGISWYNEAYYNWQDYMAAAGATSCGANGNLTAPTGLAGVTSWALRSRMEGVSTYGWIWETGSSAGGAATATPKMSLQAISGNLQIAGSFTAGGNVTAYSDERLKTDIQTLDGKKVFQMRGVSFTKDGEVGSGVIAQELEKIAPELVHTDVNEMGTKSVAYGNITGYLIEAIKNQQSEIDELKLLITQLLEK